MQEFKIGDTVLVPMKIIEVSLDTYMVAYRNESFWVFKKTVTNCEQGKTYEDGLAEAWMTAKRITADVYDKGFTSNELVDMFNTPVASNIFQNFSPQEASERIAAFEDKNVMKVGDVVYLKGTTVPAVVSKEKNGDVSRVYVIWDDGSCGPKEKALLEKSGRTVDIAEFMSKIGEEPKP